MRTTVFSPSLRHTAVAVAVMAACMGAYAASDDDEAEPRDSVQTTISMGVGLLSDDSADRAQFGQYRGLRADRSAVASLGIDYSLRKESTSTWVQLQGTDLTGDERELHLVWKNPGNWKLSADYSELLRVDPNTANTGLTRIGFVNPVVANVTPGYGSDVQLSTKRSASGLGFAKWINPSLQLELDLKSENKTGTRLSGIGMNCPSVIAPVCGSTTGWGVLMMPEPIMANHSQVEARMSYAQEALRFNVGYYGSFYRNDYSTLTPSLPGSLNTTSNASLLSILGQPLALAPNNEAHQWDLSGSYDFTKTTRATLKLARAVSIQNQNFASAGLTGAPAGLGDLGAQVNTTTGKLGLTSRPMPQLTLLADVRYEDRDDQTPIALYNNEGTATYTNHRLPYRKTQGKLQASWQFNGDTKGTFGVDQESVDRGVFTATSAMLGVSALRQNTDETTVRADLRNKFSDEFSGTMGISRSRRDGSNWLRDNAGLGVTEVTNPADPVNGLSSTAVFMPTLADRQRDKLKFAADWQASEALSIQLVGETGRDQYTVPSAYGLRDTGMNQLSVDWTYALSDNWSLNGYLAQSQQSLNQARPAGYIMAFDNRNLSASLGATGKINAQLNVGGSLAYMSDKSAYAQTLDTLASSESAALLASSGGLPDVEFRQTTLKLFGKYALDKSSAVRVDLVYQETNTNDWAWGANGTSFAYSDGSTVWQRPSQSVGFVGVTYQLTLP
ncbi:MAG: MtrB/PioB family decaheme-associated outer membrane protein [Comamonadaceae bacterium]